MAKLLGNNKLYVESPKKVAFINNIEIGGTKARTQVGRVPKNSTVYFDAEELYVKDASLLSDLSCYNVFEQVYGATAVKKPLRKVIVEGLELDAANTNNIFSMYSFVDNATITFKNCVFNLCDGANSLRVDNLKNAHNVMITYDQCTWTFKGTTYGKDWCALMIFQDSAHVDPAFGDWSLVVKNCKFGEEDITPATFAEYADFVIDNTEDKEGKALLYVYRSSNEKWFKPAENPEVFPTVKIIAGNANKVYKA